MMPRHIKVAAAQMSPNDEGTSRQEMFECMWGLLAQAAREQLAMGAHPSGDALGITL
jgi:hypothetical protein